MVTPVGRSKLNGAGPDNLSVSHPPVVLSISIVELISQAGLAVGTGVLVYGIAVGLGVLVDVGVAVWVAVGVAVGISVGITCRET